MYTILEFPGEGLMLTSSEYGRQIWAVSKLTRKHNGDKCTVCGQPVGEYAYRPITNLSNRMMRICLRHSLIEDHISEHEPSILRSSCRGCNRQRHIAIDRLGCRQCDRAAIGDIQDIAFEYLFAIGGLNDEALHYSILSTVILNFPGNS